MMKNEKECCPKFNPRRWDEITLSWKGKQFIKESIPTLFHIPFPPMIGKKITKMCDLADNSKAMPKDKLDWLVLFRDPHPFRSELYMSVTKPVKDADNTKISGNFVAKVFDGPYNAIPKFIKEMSIYLDKKEKKAKDYYVHYAYCPKCSKKFGKNFIKNLVILSKRLLRK